MDEILRIEKEVSINRTVVNLSSWNSSNHYENELFKRMTPLEINYSSKYIYSYDIPIEVRDECIRKITGKKIIMKCACF